MPLIVGLPDYMNRDLVLLYKGDSITSRISSDLTDSGWSGGQFARWVSDGSGQPCLGMSDGRFCGFMPFGSAETGDRWTSTADQNTTYGYAVLYFGGCFFYTRIYETYGYMARNSLGPMVPLTYTAQAKLYISENGKITTENESDLTVFPPHNDGDGNPVIDQDFESPGICSVPPSAASKQYIGVQTLGI